CLQNIQLPLTF
nr:immunoglobulin light chain junction region [Macaca mulatta]